MSAPQRILRIAARFLRSLRFCEALAKICAINYTKLFSCTRKARALLHLLTPGTDIGAHLRIFPSDLDLAVFGGSN